MDQILQEPPSIIFLDVDKKGSFGDPFIFVKELHPYLNELPSFIALSSSKRRAYDVIKNSFLDYLLKPISIMDLRKCLMKFKKQTHLLGSERICLKSYSDYQFIDLDDIIYLMADNNTTDFFLLNDRKVSAYKTLKHFGSLLPHNFLRIHKSYIINTQHITRINFGKSWIALRGKSENIPFSRSYKPQIAQLKERFYLTQTLAS